MGGVQTATRLGRLIKLRAKLNQEIAAEQMVCRVAPQQVSAEQVQAFLDRLGVTSGDVKRWGKAQGLIPEVRRGRIAHWLVQAYAEAHREEVGGPVDRTSDDARRPVTPKHARDRSVAGAAYRTADGHG